MKLKSVWIKKAILTMLNNKSSVLYQSFVKLSSFVDSKEFLMCLYEPEFSAKNYFVLNDSCSFETSDMTFLIEETIIGDLKKNRKTIISNGNCYAPLCFDNISLFGFLAFKGKFKNNNLDDFQQSLIAFSYFLFNESSSCIIESYHNTVFNVEKLCVNYNNGKLVNKVVKDVSFKIYEKEFTMIFGSSGSGKSSILNVLGGMLTASAGKVYYKNQDITNLNDKQKTNYRCNSVGFIFQRYNLISGLTVEENIKIAASIVKNPLSVKEVLEMVGLSGKEKKFPSQLSGGEQQRVCIARALVKRSDILFCDEPTGALDNNNSLLIMKILQNIAKERGIPVLVITHNPNFVVLADHSITIENGQIVQDIFQPFPLKVEDLEK